MQTLHKRTDKHTRPRAHTHTTHAHVQDAASGGIVCSIIALHVNCHTSEEVLRGLAGTEVVLLFLRLLYFAMASDKLGSFFRCARACV